jgi:uncharacterized membrane protein HdeD (DUF308 family)
MQRVKKVLLALMMILCSAYLVIDPETGFFVVALIVSVSLVLYGMRTLLYYLSMARHMVGGKSILFIGIIVTDLGVFILTTVDDPKLFIVVYLLAVHAFSGAMGVLRALEAKRYAAPSWKWSLLGGIANLTVAVLAVIAELFLRSTAILSFLYAATLFYSACVQLVSAFRKTAIVYIQ